MILDVVSLAKLFLALGGFLVISYYGMRSRRFAGLLLTFPLLNGIALLASPDPFRVAQAIYPIVIFNGILFWVAISTVRWLPPKRWRFPSSILLIGRASCWGAVWFFFAYYLTDRSDEIVNGIMWFAFYVCASFLMVYCFWTQPKTSKEIERTPSGTKDWTNWIGRIALFVLAFFGLLFVATHASDQKWVGMAGALPLPGIFAVHRFQLKIEKSS